MNWEPEIFTFLDYRKYLAAYYEAAKANVNAFSYRYFARKAGYKSPNFLKLVIDGERNLSADSIGKFSNALKHTNEESRFFADLVALDQASDAEEKNLAFERVAASRRFRNARQIDADLYEYLSRWYLPAIREMAARPDFSEDPFWISKQLLPTIPARRAEEGLALLLRLGLLKRDEKGRILRGEPSLKSGHEVIAFAAGNFHREMLEKAGQSIERVKREHRDLQALTVCISQETAKKLKDRVQAFAEASLDLCDRDDNPTTVYQLGVQLFPLSHVGD